MFRAEKLPAQSTTAEPPHREIHIYVDRVVATLRVEPRGVLEHEAVNEIIDVIGFPLRGGAAEIVATAAAITERHGWRTVATWLDSARDLHIQQEKP